MKKQSAFFFVVGFSIFLSQCANKEKEQLVGIWQLEQMNINGTNLDGHSLGNWLWEFNEHGGYLSNIAGATEKGSYKLSANKLTLEITLPEKHPAQVYTLNKIDSASLKLASTDSKNRAILRFTKWKEKIGEEKE